MRKQLQSHSRISYTLLVAILLLSSPHLRSEEKEGRWFKTNASLIKPASVSLCKPVVTNTLFKKVKVCPDQLELKVPLRIRLLEGMEIKGKTYIGFQFLSELGVITAWSNFRDKGSIQLDEGAEMFLLAAPSIHGQQQKLVGRWAIEHWNVPEDWPKHSGYMEITPGQHINEFLGKMVVTVDTKHNTQGQIRRRKIISGFKSTYSNTIKFSMNGNRLTAIGTFPTMSNVAYAFDLVLESDDRLTGVGGELQWPKYEYKYLPEIRFSKEF